ncbi:MAG: acyltransferase [Ilumatobacteraceae bacterium]
MLNRPLPARRASPEAPWRRGVAAGRRAAGEVVQWAWATAAELAAIGPDTARGRRFGAFGEGSVICFPHNAIVNEAHIHLGVGTVVGPGATLSAGMARGQAGLGPRVVSIGDRCLLGKGTGIVGHLEIVLGDDVWTGHHVYLTDQNHGYADPTVPISRQVQPERPVYVGDGSWLGHGSVVLPGARIGRHVVIGANSVVTGTIPDFTVAVGAPARVVATIPH